jgi:hypothetical protein
VQGPQGTQGPQGAQGSNGVNAFYGYAGSYSYVSMPESTPTVVATLTPGVRGAYAATGTVNVGGDYSASCYMATKSSGGGVSSVTPAVFDYNDQGAVYRDITLTMTGAFLLDSGSVIETVCRTHSGSDTAYGNQTTALKVSQKSRVGSIARAHHVKAAVNARGQRVK